MNNIKINLAEALKAARLKAGLTQKQVAERMGLKCEDRLSHWERGQALPDVSNLLKLSKILNVGIDSLTKQVI